MRVDFKFKNGQKVKCIITGFNGTVDCASKWINGCIRYSVQPMMKKGETTMPDSMWIDEQNLKLVSEGVSKKIKPKPVGGPSSKSSNARM